MGAILVTPRYDHPDKLTRQVKPFEHKQLIDLFLVTTKTSGIQNNAIQDTKPPLNSTNIESHLRLTCKLSFSLNTTNIGVGFCEQGNGNAIKRRNEKAFRREVSHLGHGTVETELHPKITADFLESVPDSGEASHGIVDSISQLDRLTIHPIEASKDRQEQCQKSRQAVR